MGVYKRAKKHVSKVARNVAREAGQAIKNRYYGGNKLNVAQIASDVAVLQRLVNVEKKRFDKVIVTPQPVGQVNGNATGAFCVDVTPLIPEGITFNSRNGASIKLTGWHTKLQLTQQASAQHPMKVKIMFFQVKGNPITTSSFITPPSSLYNWNSFVGGGSSVVDYNSDINPDNFSKYKLIRQKVITLQPDPLSGTTMLKTFSIGMKYKKGHHVRYDGDTTNVLNGQILMLVLCDSGNMSTTTASTLSNVPVSGINTGATLLYDFRSYYVDN